MDNYNFTSTVSEILKQQNALYDKLIHSSTEIFSATEASLRSFNKRSVQLGYIAEHMANALSQVSTDLSPAIKSLNAINKLTLSAINSINIDFTSISDAFIKYSQMHTINLNQYFDDDGNLLKDVEHNVDGILDKCSPEDFDEITITEDGCVTMPSPVAAALSSFETVPEACFEKTQNENSFHTTKEIFFQYLIPILLPLLIFAAEMTYTIWNDYQTALETKAYRNEVLQEEHKQTSEAEKQTQYLKKLCENSTGQ